MRPKYSTSTKIISDIMHSLDNHNYLLAKIRLRNNYKHLKYLWKWHARNESKGFGFELRQKSFVDSEDIIYIIDKWQSSYRIQNLMAWSNCWKWMIIYEKKEMK